ncbi:MAG: PDZ domain-containing protein [Magnetococcales bacterium]|nr:PDZ domain-containing protein [Magnetococcales bacterium]
MRTRYRSLLCTVIGLLLFSRPAQASGWLGVTIQPPQGAQVAEIYKDGPADRSGLKKGDVIRQVDAILVRSLDHFTDLINQTPAGREVTLTIWRGKEEIKIKAILDSGEDHLPFSRPVTERWSQPPFTAQPPQNASPPAAFGQPMERTGRESWRAASIPREERLQPPPPSVWLGVAPGVAPGGVAIVDVAPHSPAEHSDLRAGDVIIAINRQAIASPDALVQALSTMRPGDLIEVTFNREGRTLMSQVQLQQAPANP